MFYFALGTGLLFGQSYQGSFDQATCGTISGWASDQSQPNTPINVDIYDGTVYVTSVPANLPGNNNHSFNLPTPPTLKDNQIHNIYARYGGTTTDLPADIGTISNVLRPLQCNSSSAGYTYYYNDTFSSINAANWTQNGSASVLTGWGLSTTSSGGGSLISKVAVQGPNSANYEVNTTVSLKQSGGYYVQYLRASTNAITGTGSYYSVELQNPTFNSTTGACSATLAGFQSINGTVTQLYSMPIACHDGMQIRTMVVGNIALTTENSTCFTVSLSSQLSSGQPGVGGRSMPSTNAMIQAEFGPWDNISPSPVNALTFTPWVTPGMVHVEWQGAVDDANGRGVGYYYITRTGGGFSIENYTASFEDTTVQAGTTYTYQIYAIDYHHNFSSASSLTVTTPPANASNYNTFQRGIRPTNTYWGGAGEQIDIFNGNLNYSVPLITAVGRGGLAATFKLVYNSENWVVTSGTTSFTETGDTGYGFGWQLMLGSIMPVVGASNGIVEYWYTDASGAQYRMTINNNGVWTGNGSFYAWYDTNTNRLYFRDGSFWIMGCVAAGGEPDAGTLYPTVLQDTNGKPDHGALHGGRGGQLDGFERAHQFH